ncbi:Glycosyltransferase involved in cell wall bisynthesis [Hymenobacter daecheongensis DSM 21074]|uniref:Glycosyltransferase involved in cell wall bisynthesis n=1 Tax=Hymenobacter daecheongensis DSM 21074 TaxID=1121955 RepID=A0A1M6E7C3_9BACT|nr:glycosyltransferase [Hymenobacter daecheongensis]SHI81335.1 Glycosyltransferase involved in cell wall bisynthesis [Hymenobacter daecheongensis DSM 21074]
MNTTANHFEALPLVTIVALCYNHARFVREALDSILAQTYPNLEVWLVDDASTDESVAILREYAAANPGWKTIFLPENIGNCAAFNRAFRQSHGEFIIDFATDDVLLPTRVAEQVAAFQRLDASYGVVYSDAELIDEDSRPVRYHYRRDAQGQPHPRPASGHVFAEVLRRYFISTPTMLMRRATLAHLDGYDETLAYEDFDFWVRAARDFQFYFLDAVTTRKRLHPASMSRRGYRPHDPFLASTIRVCRKALLLCRTPDERAALAVRLRWELRQAVRWGNFRKGAELYGLLLETQSPQLLDRVLGAYARLRKGQ